MSTGAVEKLIGSRIPTEAGEFALHLYRGDDGKDHLAFVHGDIRGREQALIRIHSECITGDVFGSRRCDCGEQLAKAIELISTEGAGAVIYLRQEGRGIGLHAKLETYNLQDRGYDTVDANLLLGHRADEREYDVAAAILKDLGVKSIRLLTNNPAKVESLARLGFSGCERMPLQTPVRDENARYLEAKARRMRHLLTLNSTLWRRAHPELTPAAKSMPSAEDQGEQTSAAGPPTVTLTYAQSLDGSIAVRRGEPMSLSGPESQRFTHALRAEHDAILIGIDTVLSDDPQLTVRRVQGPDPQPVVLDSRLRTPTSAKLFEHPTMRPWIATTEAAPAERQERLEAAGATVLRLPAADDGRVDLDALLAVLAERRVRSLMVEGGARVITSFLAAQLVDRLVLTVVPLLVGGLSAVGDLAERNGDAFPVLRNPHYEWVGNDLVIVGEL